MDYHQKIIIDFELHSVQGIQECFEKGVGANDSFEGKPLIYKLINMYTRGSLFKQCIRVFMEHGLEMKDDVLLAVLADDADRLSHLLNHNPAALQNMYSFDCAFTPLTNASLLHICAEYNHVNCANILVKHGLDANTKAGVDEHGFGGQTPVFHTVNQDANKSIDMLKFLISQNADLNITVKGLVWGRGYNWETFIPSVNPISYAMMGLLRQFQRTEQDIDQVVSLLMKAKYGIEYHAPNIPNKYLQG
jgi:hypothetical protein